MLTGKKSELENSCNELELRFEKGGISFIIAFRVYDEGVAFRYSFPQAPSTQVQVFQEKTTFSMQTGGKMWVQEYSPYKPVYERRYLEKNVGESYFGGWCMPGLFETAGHFVLISETNLREYNWGSHLAAWNGTGYQVGQPPQNDGSGNSDAYPLINSAMDMPWRFLVIADDIKSIVESNLSHHLADPSVLTDDSWIETGVCTFSWWTDNYSSTNYQTLQRYTELADSLQVPFTLVDADWPQMTGGNLQQLISYASSMGVGVWVWYNSGGPHSSYTNQPMDKMLDSTVRNQEFTWLKSIGARGVKIDFFESDKQHMIKYYLDILQDAARYELMISFHGCIIPSGWQRTYPHLLTAEGVKGAEGLLFDPQFRDDSPQHNVNVTYTRNVVSSMDYTASAIGYDRVNHTSTKAHEMAMVVAFESGVQNLTDSYANYLALTKKERKLLAVPSAWDETRFVAGYPGQYVVLARRKGRDWYLAGMNGTSLERNIIISPSDFLEAGWYRRSGVTDHSSDHQQFVYQENLNMRSEEVISLTLKPSGGFLFKFESKCPDLLSQQQSITGDYQFSGAEIITADKINLPSKLAFRAEKSVILKEGFETSPGTTVEVTIGQCPQN